MAIRDILVLNTTASRAETQQGSDTVAIRGNSGKALSVENSSGTSILSVNTVSSSVDVAGKITATGNITAFASDIRLKTEIKPIENAVAKLLKLNGFTYELNELAGSLGYELDGERYSGVSAQDVKEVLPEAVKPAPINEEYMTVQYEKLVPLLIEAIKELKAEIDELKK